MAAGDIIIPDNTITPEIMAQIATEVTKLIGTNAKDPGQWEEVASLTGITSLPVFQVMGNAYKLVRVAVSTLKGVNGREVELQVDEGRTAIQWRYVGVSGSDLEPTEWKVLIDLKLIKGDPGETPDFRKGPTGLEWKYKSEDDGAWRTLISTDDLKLKFSDLTEEEIADFWRGVPDDFVAMVRQPATDAAAEVRERMSRIEQDAGQVISDTNEARDAAMDATANALSVLDHPGYIGDDFHVYTWDYVTGAYKKTERVLRPEGFQIYRVYSSVGQMEADAPNVEEGKFVVINTGSVEDEDTGRLYVKTEAGFEYLVDISGMRGFTGKTPQLTIGTVVEGEAIGVTLTDDGEDENGNPKYKVNFVLRRGPRGFTPVIVTGTTTTGLPGTDASAELLPDGQTEDGRDKYQLNVTIPRGDAGKGSVSAPGTGLAAGKEYLFVPAADNSTDGEFVEYVAPVIPGKISDLENDNHTVQDVNYVHTDNNYTDADKEKLAAINFVPTLDHEPGDGDLSFSDSDGEHAFLIGNLARVFDSGKEEYVFWRLYDIKDDKAVWKKAGSGGDVVMSEKVEITLSSNQAQPDMALNGLVVHVKYGDNDTPLTWNGAAMTVEIPINMTYTIEYPDLEGYSSPENEEYIALAGNTRQVEAFYNTTVLTINVDSNQSDKSDLNSAQVTLSGSITKILNYSGSPLTVKVPTGKQVTVSVSQLDGYATVGEVTKTPTASVDTVSFAYNTTIMSITLTSNQGTDATLNAGTNVVVECGAINKTLIWKGATLTQKIPTGQAYTITPAALSGYKTPAAKTGTASGVNMSETMQYQTEVVTVTVNTDNSMSCAGQKVTIAGTEYTYDNPIVVKIPHGTDYSVSVNSKAGFTSPDAQSFTANQVSRTITMTYLEIKRGIFILDTSGNLVRRSDWSASNNSKAVGVAVLSDNCKFVISPSENPSNIAWGESGIYVSGVLANTQASVAKTDFKGRQNTDNIIAQLGAGTVYNNCPAATYCRGVTFKHGKTGYLGSCGEWQEAYNNKTEVDACMSLIEGTAISTSNHHWTSTQHSGTDAWRLLWSDGRVSTNNKANSDRVRVFAAL